MTVDDKQPAKMLEADDDDNGDNDDNDDDRNNDT